MAKRARTPTVHRPDNWIRNGTRAWVGNNRYNTTGANQTRTAKVRKGGKTTYYARVQNDGTVPDTFKVKGGRHERKWAVTYRCNGKDISNGVRAGTYRFTNLDRAILRSDG